MKKYKVTLVRTATQVQTVAVEAKSPKDAEAKALDVAPDLDFAGCTKDYDYEAEVEDD